MKLSRRATTAKAAATATYNGACGTGYTVGDSGHCS
ncbi:hypothetical protein C7821_10827 [Streptomyces sp. VMFN-G11Ma]|jgi:hypothetical protein|nr:hypothetical protein C7821_10827 [Streptomyces sp. VMFN-G11Ma]